MTTKKFSKLKTYLSANYTEFADEQTSLRLNSLYSDFSNAHAVNPYAYDANVEFWKCIILDCNEQGLLGTLDYATAINKATLPGEFHRPLKGKPMALSCVLDHLEKEGSIIQISKFIELYAPKIGWSQWFYNKVSPWSYWSQSQSTHNLIYIVMPTIVAITKKILSEHFSRPVMRGTDHIIIFSEFKAKYAHQFVNGLELTDNDLELILRYLSSEQGVAIADNIKGYGTTYKVIKFPLKQGEIAEITKHDEALINIQTTCNALSLQVDELQKKAEEFGQKSIKEHASGHLARARYYLRRRKSLEQVLEKRLKSMETMDTILTKIETSHDDIQVVQAFNAGAGTLRDLLGQDELSIETIHEVMTKVSDSLEEQKKVEEAMHTGIEDNLFDQEIEQELAELVEKETEYVRKVPPMNTTEIEDTKDKTDEKSAIIPTDNTSRSELARLNHMFTNIRNTPSSEKTRQEQLELA